MKQYIVKKPKSSKLVSLMSEHAAWLGYEEKGSMNQCYKWFAIGYGRSDKPKQSTCDRDSFMGCGCAEISLYDFFALTPEDVQSEPEEMTMEQLEKELGRKIKIVGSNQ